MLAAARPLQRGLIVLIERRGASGSPSFERTLAQLKVTATISGLLLAALVVGASAHSVYMAALVGLGYVLRTALQEQVGDIAVVPPMALVLVLVYYFDPQSHATASSFMVGMAISWAAHANAVMKPLCTRFLISTAIGTVTDTLVYATSSSTIPNMGTTQMAKLVPVLIVYLILRGQAWRRNKTTETSK